MCSFTNTTSHSADGVGSHFKAASCQSVICQSLTPCSSRLTPAAHRRKCSVRELIKSMHVCRPPPPRVPLQGTGTASSFTKACTCLLYATTLCFKVNSQRRKLVSVLSLEAPCSLTLNILSKCNPVMYVQWYRVWFSKFLVFFSFLSVWCFLFWLVLVS